MEQLLINLGLIEKKNIKLEHKGTRDNPKIDVKKCKKSNIIWLNTETYKDYSKETLDEYKIGTYIEDIQINTIRNETFTDDKRRHKLMMKNHLDKNKNILDFGCGTGGFLNLMKDNFNVFGVEMSDIYRKILNEEGFKVCKNINKFDFNFDIICLWHVFEHLNEPIKILRTLKNKLKKGGIIYIEVPHAEDILLSKYECESFKDFTYWSEHLILHTKQSLKIFIEAAGLNVLNIINIQRYNLINHLYWLSKNKPGGQKFWLDMDSNDLNYQYEKKLKEMNKTDTIIAICSL